MTRKIMLSMLQYDLIKLSELCLLSMILALGGCYGADYRYEACGPRNCSSGPNVHFPFYIPGVHGTHCGHPAFALNCNNQGSPVLQLTAIEYVVEDIFYQSTSLRLYMPVVLGLNDNSCPYISDITLPETYFTYGSNMRAVHLLSNCSDPLPVRLDELGFKVSCHGEDSSNNWTLAIYDTEDSPIVNFLKKHCGIDVLIWVEWHGYDDGNNGLFNLTEVLRRGFVLNYWTDSNCRPCEDSGGRCGYNETTNSFMCFCPDRPRAQRCKPRKSKLGLILGSGFAAALGIIFILIIIILTMRKKIKNALDDKANIELLLKHYENLAPRRYKFSELKKMTRSYIAELGKGGYGSVYKAKSQDGRLLAVKVLNESKNNGEEFINEVASISRTSHVNIVALLGFCFEGSKRALVYEYMPNGSLEKFIDNPSLFGERRWEKLFEIAVGIARGLEYLHRGCEMQILHFDIKPHNILLDKDFQPKISDFGLAKLCPNRASIVSMSGTRGTIGYIAPEVFCRNFGNVSPKSDVYSFGMMLLEMVREVKNTDPGTRNTSEAYFPHWIYKHLELDGDRSLDKIMEEEDEGRLTKRKLTIVGLWCIQTDPRDRPSMSKVVEMLEGKLESLSIPPKSYLSSPPTPAADASFSVIYLVCYNVCISSF